MAKRTRAGLPGRPFGRGRGALPTSAPGGPASRDSIGALWADRPQQSVRVRLPRSVWHRPASDPTGRTVSRPALTRDDVAHLAHLARLELTDDELDRYGDQLSVILSSVAEVTDAVGDQQIEPTSHAVPLTNVFRADEVRPGLTREQALDQAPAAEDGQFRVPQILGEE